MKLSWTVLLVIIVALAINIQSGCQETGKVTETKTKIIAQPKQTKMVAEGKKHQTKEPIRIQDKASQMLEEKTPVIKIEKPVHDFGKVLPNNKYVCEFNFENIGNAPLKITKIQSTCGCTVPQLKKKIYNPGETGKINVTFRTPVREGKTTKRLYVLSNDKKEPKFALTLRATVELKVSFKPKSLELSLKAEDAGAKPLTITSKDGQPFAIKSIASTRNVVTFDFDPQVEATEFVLKPKIDMTLLKNNLKGNISVNITHPASGPVNIPYSTLALFSISRPRIVIQNADPEKPLVKDVWITSNYGDKIEIESISSLNGHMEVLSQRAEGNGVNLEVQVTPPPQTEKSKRYFRDELKIKVKGSADDLLVRCNGWYPR